MHKLIILRGNSGSGKTSVAKALQNRFGSGTMLVSHDMIRMEILHVWSREGIIKSEPLMINLLKYGKEHSEITIMEGVLHSEEYNRLFETALAEYGKNIFAYYYDLPFEETLFRHNTKPNRNDFGETDMKRWWREKDFLPMISETVITKDSSFDDTVGMIYRHVTEAIKNGFD